MVLIRDFKVKLKLINDIFKGKCCKCNVDFLKLPVLQFHHPDPNKKTTSWRKIRRRSYKHIVKKLTKDNVILLCSNCHLKEQAKIYYNYYGLITFKDLFLLSAEKIRDLIIQKTSMINIKLERMHKREKIKEWIKKRYVVEQLYDGKCIACGNSDLTSLAFHHLDVNYKNNKSKWGDLETYNSEKIMEILIKENTVTICSNCHTILHSRFHEFAHEILNDFFSILDVKRYLKKIRNDYENISKNIQNFKFRFNNINFRSPLELEIPHTEVWKIHLLKMFYYMKYKNIDFFKVYDLKPILKISIRHIYKHLHKFIEKKLIGINNPHSHFRKYILTDLGHEKIKQLKNDYKELDIEIENEVFKLLNE